MALATELQDALGLPLEAIQWHTKDFRPLPISGRYLLLGADGTFREPRSEKDLQEYLEGGEFDEVQDQADDWEQEGEEEVIYLCL